MAEVERLDHEAGDFSEYDNTPSGGFTVTTSGLGGTTYKVEVDHDGDFSTIPVSSYSGFSGSSSDARIGFRFNKNTIGIASDGSGCNLLEWNNAAGSAEMCAFTFENSGGSLVIKATVDLDGASTQVLTSSTIPAGDVAVEVHITRASSDVASDGTATLYINGSQDDQATGLDNYDDWTKYNSSGGLDLAASEFGAVTGILYIDEIVLRDDSTKIFQNYSYIQSSGGLAKYALAVSQDGNNVFVALEDNSTNNQIIFKATRPSSPTVSAIYEPGGGSAANVIATGDPDIMIFFGNFGTDIGVIQHAIAADTETDISPTSIGSDKIQPAAVDPSDTTHIVAINQTDQDALETEDAGSNWSTLNATLGQAPVAMGVLWLGSLFPLGGFIGGNDGTDENLTYTPNEFNDLREDTSAALKAVGAITGIDLTVS